MGYHAPREQAWCPKCKKLAETLVMALRAEAQHQWNSTTHKYDWVEDLVDTEELAGPARCDVCGTLLEEPPEQLPAPAVDPAQAGP